MAYVTVTHWTTTEWTTEMVQQANRFFVPSIISTGASSVQMVKTGDLSFCVITLFANEATGVAAQQKIAEIREKAASDLPMKMVSAVGGSVFAASSSKDLEPIFQHLSNRFRDHDSGE